MSISDSSSVPRGLVAGFVLAGFALLVGGATFYLSQERMVRERAEENLEAVAALKVREIVTWRQEQLAKGRELMASRSFIGVLDQWLRDGSARGRELIVSRMGGMAEAYHYSEITLADAAGERRLSYGGTLGPLHAAAADAVRQALDSGQAVLTDLCIEGGSPPHISLVAPLFAEGDPGRLPVGAVILTQDAGQVLYPLIQLWPTSSRSAETLLVRRDGDAVLFLNELRHQTGTAFRLRFPLAQTTLPAVQAVLGHQGVFRGVDYRDVDVVSVVKAIPDSPWYMVAKVDADEVFSEWRRYSAMILSALAALLASLGLAAAVLWHRQAARHYRSLFMAEARYGATLRSIGDGVIVTDGAGRVELLNPVAETLTGWPDGEARGRPLRQVFHIVHEPTRAPAEDPVERVLREGTVVGLANHTMLISRDGIERPIADSGAPIRGEGDAIAGAVLVFRDQTEERAAAAELQESEARYRRLADHSADVIYRLRLKPEPAYEYVSPATSTILGYTPEEHYADPQLALKIVHPEDRASLEAVGADTDPDLFSGPVTQRWIRRDGEVVWLEQQNVPIRGEHGDLIAIEGIARDVTERVRREEQLRTWNETLEERVAERTAELAAAVRELEAFSYSVSHDLKAPLRAIDGYSALLEESAAFALDPGGQGLVREVRLNAQKMGHLIEDLLAYSRVGRTALTHRAVDVAALVRELVERERQLAPGRRIELETDGLDRIWGDATLVRQVLDNLIGNAVKFTRPREVARIRVTGRPVDGMVEIAVRDNGVGFDPRYRHKLFRVFERLHDPGEFEGTGVGLAIVKRIVERHGGSVSAESDLDRGTVIHVTLPAAPERHDDLDEGVTDGQP